MNCPTCRSAITKPGKFCVSCGHDFGDELYGKLSFYFVLKDEFEELGKVQDSFSARLAALFAKIQDYEALLEADLGNAHASPTPGKKTAVEPAPTVTDRTRETVPVASGVMSAPGSIAEDPNRERLS